MNQRANDKARGLHGTQVAVQNAALSACVEAGAWTAGLRLLQRLARAGTADEVRGL